MKKKLSFLFVFLFPLLGYSQFRVNNADPIILPGQQGVDFICVINKIQSSTELEYTGEGTSFNWVEYSKSNAFKSNQKGISPEDGVGYLLTVDGKEWSIWVFDYKNYIDTTKNKTLSVEQIEGDCEELKLNYSGEIRQMSYVSRNGVTHTLPREFKLEYESLEWNGDKWEELRKEETFILPEDVNGIVVDAPLKDTKFRLSGDVFAEKLALNPLPFVDSELYKTQRIDCKITTAVITRDALNELERPKELKQLKGSAPLDLAFESNATKVDDIHFNWSLYREKKLLVKRTGESHRYTFTEPGTYQMTLSLSNAHGCIATDTVEVEVAESLLEVPNVFTPNGDGKNDEFRVAYRSLESFSCWVYDSWGNAVYNWSNPEKGWDGRIRGREAPSGAYFYIIKARGTDGIVYDLKGDINIIR